MYLYIAVLRKFLLKFMLRVASRLLLCDVIRSIGPGLLCLVVATVVLILLVFTTGAYYVCLFSRLGICCIYVPLYYLLHYA
jgi:hypothetical protein